MNTNKNNDLLIYLAEDNDEDTLFVKLSFSKNNFSKNLVCFPNGSELIKALKNKKPDCILLDMNMPVLDGFEVFEYLKSHKIDGIPTFVMSSSTIHEEMLKEKGCHPTAFIMKPATYEKTMSALKETH